MKVTIDTVSSVMDKLSFTVPDDSEEFYFRFQRKLSQLDGWFENSDFTRKIVIDKVEFHGDKIKDVPQLLQVLVKLCYQDKGKDEDPILYIRTHMKRNKLTKMLNRDYVKSMKDLLERKHKKYTKIILVVD
jgi:hypothetical protein